MLQVGSFSAQPGAVIHDLAIDLAGCEVDKTQDFPQKADVHNRAKRSADFWLVLWVLYHTRPVTRRITPVTIAKHSLCNLKFRGAPEVSGNSRRALQPRHRDGPRTGSWAYSPVPRCCGTSLTPSPRSHNPACTGCWRRPCIVRMSPRFLSASTPHTPC